MTLDAILCDWCPQPTLATNHVSLNEGHSGWLCGQHCNEAASEFTALETTPLDSSESEGYALLESAPESAYLLGHCSVTVMLEGERCGFPYPVSGDATALDAKERKWMQAKMSHEEGYPNE